MSWGIAWRRWSWRAGKACSRGRPPDMRVAVVGARGQLGTAIVREFEPRHDVVAFARDTLDISDDAAVAAAMARAQPQAIINCAAYNDVDGAEDHPVEALNA